MSDIVEVTSSITLIEVGERAPEELEELELSDIEIPAQATKTTPFLRLVPPPRDDEEATTTYVLPVPAPTVTLPLPPRAVVPSVTLPPVTPPPRHIPTPLPPAPSFPSPQVSSFASSLPPVPRPPRPATLPPPPSLPPISRPPISSRPLSSRPAAGVLPPPPSLPPMSRPPGTLPPPPVVARPSPLPPPPSEPPIIDERPLPPQYTVKEETLSEPSIRKPMRVEPPVVIVPPRNEITRIEPVTGMRHSRLFKRRESMEAMMAALGVVVLVAAGATFALMLRDSQGDKSSQARPPVATAPALLTPPMQQVVPTATVPMYAPPPAAPPVATYETPTNAESLPLESAPLAAAPPVVGGYQQPSLPAPPRTRSYTSSSTPSTSAAGQGTLSFNSLPISSVVLDGRPIGNTPLTGVRVSAGPHTVLFVHPDGGRAVRRVTVAAGGTQSVGVRF